MVCMAWSAQTSAFQNLVRLPDFSMPVTFSPWPKKRISALRDHCTSQALPHTPIEAPSMPLNTVSPWALVNCKLPDAVS